jgi:hypothetical protein
MVLKPTILPEWAENDVVDPISGQNNVLEPPTEKKLEGWARLEFPPRNWFNWLGRYTNRWLSFLKQQEELAILTDGNGVGLFPYDGSVGTLITLTAVDLANPTNYVFAIGAKKPGLSPTLTVVSNNILTLGAGTLAGNQIVNGGTASNILVWGQTKTYPTP